MNPTAISDPTSPVPSVAATSPAEEIGVPAPASGSSDKVPLPPEYDAFNPVLLRLKQEAEDDVKRLRAELSQSRKQLLEYDMIEERAKIVLAKREYKYSEKAAEIREKLPSLSEWDELKKAHSRLETELKAAEGRVETELATIRQAELAASSAGTRPSRAKRELAELFETAMGILPEYARKLDQLVQDAKNVWHQREKRPDSLTQLTSVIVGRDLDVFLNMALLRLGREFLALSEPLRQWINKMSAVLEEGRITDLQRMELRLRLIELEVKFQTAGQLLKQLNVL